MAKTRIASEEFIKAWESSSNVAEVSKKLGLKPASVMARASKYRTAPLFMPLKQMKRGGGAKIDIAKTKELLASLQGTNVETIDVASAKLVERYNSKETAATTVVSQ